MYSNVAIQWIRLKNRRLASNHQRGNKVSITAKKAGESIKGRQTTSVVLALKFAKCNVLWGKPTEMCSLSFLTKLFNSGAIKAF